MKNVFRFIDRLVTTSEIESENILQGETETETYRK